MSIACMVDQSYLLSLIILKALGDKYNCQVIVTGKLRKNSVNKCRPVSVTCVLIDQKENKLI
jgi:hypothetical protein